MWSAVADSVEDESVLRLLTFNLVLKPNGYCIPFSKTLLCLCVSFMKGGRERKGVKLWHKQHPLPTFMVQQLATYCHLQKQTEKQSKNRQTADMLQCGIFFCCGIKIQWHHLGNALTLATSLESQDPAWGVF